MLKKMIIWLDKRYVISDKAQQCAVLAKSSDAFFMNCISALINAGGKLLSKLH
jgi:hypothetical protein